MNIEKKLHPDNKSSQEKSSKTSFSCAQVYPNFFPNFIYYW